MPIPDFREDGWLPPGHHKATWEEVAEVFGGADGSSRRSHLLRLLLWREELRRRGIAGRLLLDGSYISTKPNPGDIDALFVFDDDSEAILAGDSEAQRLINHQLLKERGIGDIFCFKESTLRQFPLMCRLDGFDLDRAGRPKGLVELRV